MSLTLASSIPVLGLERVCPQKGCALPRIFLCPWPWPRALCPRFRLCLFATVTELRIVLEYPVTRNNQTAVISKASHAYFDTVGYFDHTSASNYRTKESHTKLRH